MLATSLRVGRLFAGLEVGLVVFDGLGEMVGNPLPHLRQSELRALETLRRCRYRVQQLHVLLHLLLSSNRAWR